MKKILNAFTLIELMLVIAILGILLSIAYPSYQEHVTKTRRTDGKTALLDLANRMERYYSETHTYATATIASGTAATDVLASANSPENWYALSITAQTATSYTLQATPQNAQGTQDTRCQSLTLNSTGLRGVTTGPAGAPTTTAANCW